MSFEAGLIGKGLSTGPTPQLYETNVSEWMKESVLSKLQPNQHLLDLTHIQKKKLKKSFYPPSDTMDTSGHQFSREV
jgi:hypothetical protein